MQKNERIDEQVIDRQQQKYINKHVVSQKDPRIHVYILKVVYLKT